MADKMLYISEPSAALSKPPADRKSELRVLSDGKCIIILTPYSNICLVYERNKRGVFKFLICLSFLAPVPAQKTPVALPEELKFLVQEPASLSQSESSLPATGV